MAMVDVAKEDKLYICLNDKRHIIRMVKWDSPKLSWVTLNTDGCSKGHYGLAGGGGVIRDYLGRWKTGFVMNIGICLTFLAELLAVYQGLQLAWVRGYRRLHLQVDCISVVKAITDELRGENEHDDYTNNLVQGCRTLLQQDWEVQVRHVYREANVVADRLSNLALITPIGLHIFDFPPPETHSLILDDAKGVCRPRFIPVYCPRP